MEIITSRQNPRFKDLSKSRDDKTLMLLEGRRLVDDALQRGFQPVAGAITAEYAERFGQPDFPHVVLTPELFAALAGTNTPQGILAVIPRPYVHLADAARHERIIILDGVQDPGNVGTMVRTAEAFGFGGMIITPGTASPFSGKALRASMGSCLGLDIAQAGFDEIARLEHRIFSLALGGKQALRHDLFGAKAAVCFGQEARGVSKEMLALSLETVYIPMPGRTESLNVAVAAAVVMACLAGVI